MILLKKKSIIYTAFSICLQLLVEVKSQTIRPDLCCAHTATLINNNLYILGGEVPGSDLTPKQAFLSLDFSTPFNTNEPKWRDLSIDIVPLHRSAAAIKGGANNCPER